MATNCVSPSSMLAQLVKKISHLYEIQTFLIVFIKPVSGHYPEPHEFRTRQFNAFRQIQLNVIIDCKFVILFESMKFYDSAINFKDNRVPRAGS